jgi:hypothetical protein
MKPSPNANSTVMLRPRDLGDALHSATKCGSRKNPTHRAQTSFGEKLGAPPRRSGALTNGGDDCPYRYQSTDGF